MGFSRFTKKVFVPFYNTRDTIDKIKIYGFSEGIKEKLREDFLEDMPIISNIYQSGKSDGHREGYIQASNEYEEKLLKQGKHFLEQQKIYQDQKEEFNELLNSYEIYIEELKSKLNNYEKLQEFISIKNELDTLK